MDLKISANTMWPKKPKKKKKPKEIADSGSEEDASPHKPPPKGSRSGKVSGAGHKEMRHARPSPNAAETTAELVALAAVSKMNSKDQGHGSKVAQFNTPTGATFLRSAIAIPADDYSVRLSVQCMKLLSLHSGSALFMLDKDQKKPPVVVTVLPANHLDCWEVGVSITVLQDTGDYVRLARSNKEVLHATEVRLQMAPVQPADGPTLDLDDPVILQYCKAQLLNRVIQASSTVQISYYGRLTQLELNVVAGLNKVLYRIDSTTAISRMHFVRSLPGASSVGSQQDTGLGAVDDILRRMLEFIRICIDPPRALLEAGLEPGHGILLHGPPGTGKSQIAACAAKKSEVSCVLHLDLADLLQEDASSKVVQYFEQARSQAPAILIMDQVDQICSNRNELRNGSQSMRLISLLLHHMDSIAAKGSGGKRSPCVIVIGTTSKPNDMDPAFRRPGRFDLEIEVPVPAGPAERLQILSALLAHSPHSLSQSHLHEIAESTHGFVGADLKALLANAALTAVARALPSPKPDAKAEGKVDKNTTSAVQLTWADIQVAMQHAKPSSLRTTELTIPTVTWDDIGGQQEAKQLLREAVSWPFKYADLFQQMGIRAPRGVLLFGPPGCSKTLMAKALANESGLNFLSVKGPELLSKWVGDSEKAVRDVFRKAHQAAPSIIFFDELDGLCGIRGSGGVSDRVISQLLTEMDGISRRSGDVQANKAVIVVAATNRPDNLDPAILRPGRIDRVIYIGLPEKDERTAILQIALKRTPHAVTEVELEHLSSLLTGYTGAEIVSLCREAIYIALEENVDVQQVMPAHLQAAMANVKPRITPLDVAFYKAWLQKFNSRT